MKILAACRQRMIDQARRDAPNETCGFFTGRSSLIDDIHPMQNVSPDSNIRYEFQPVEHFKKMMELDRAGIPILGVYHSHPASEAYPSETDVARALLLDGTPTYPDYLYIIISLKNPAAPVTNAFRILPGGTVREEELEVE